MPLNIRHNVTLFPQPTNMTCWSAAATMLFGDRSVGAGDATLSPSGGLQPSYANIQRFARSHGLRMLPVMSWTVDGLANELRAGPLWVAGWRPTGHAYVVHAMTGDGSMNGTTIHIADPWPPNKGSRYTKAYGPWVQQFPTGMMYMLQR